MQKRPLEGCRIVVTRSAEQASELAELLEQEGAKVYAIPAIEITEQEEGIRRLESEWSRIAGYSWLIFTSVNTVKIVDRLLRKAEITWKLFDSLNIACIGTATARKVTGLGGKVQLLPPVFRAESLAEELIKQNLAGQKVLLPRAAGSRPVLPLELRRAGATVEEIHIYKAELPQQSKNELLHLLESARIDFLTFTSSSTVRNFAELAGDLPWQNIPVACIGPITAQTLREYGIQPAVEAREFTIPGLVQALKAFLIARPASGRIES